MPPDAFTRLFDPRDPDDDDGPELHITGLSGRDLDAWFALLREHGAGFGDSVVWLDDEQRDARVEDVPDVARAVVERGASTTPSAGGVRIGETVLPTFGFFAHAEEIELFWYPSAGRWDPAAVDAFVELLRRYRQRVPNARLAPDPRYLPRSRELIAEALAQRLGPDAITLD